MILMIYGEKKWYALRMSRQTEEFMNDWRKTRNKKCKKFHYELETNKKYINNNDVKNKTEQKQGKSKNWQ